MSNITDKKAQAQVTERLAEEKNSQQENFNPETSNYNNVLMALCITFTVCKEFARWKLEYVKMLHICYSLRYVIS